MTDLEQIMDRLVTQWGIIQAADASDPVRMEQLHSTFMGLAEPLFGAAEDAWVEYDNFAQNAYEQDLATQRPVYYVGGGL